MDTLGIDCAVKHLEMKTLLCIHQLSLKTREKITDNDNQKMIKWLSLQSTPAHSSA